MLPYLLTFVAGLLIGFFFGHHKGYYRCLNEPDPPPLSEAEKRHGYFERVYRNPADEAEPFVRNAESEERSN